MKKIENAFNKIKKWFLKPIRNLLLTLAILPTTVLALLHLPVVQQQLLRSVAGYLHQTTHYQIKCDAFRFTWLHQVTLEGLTVTDPEDKPLFTIYTCKGRLNVLSLLLLKSNIIDSISVTGGQLFLEKQIDQDWNLATFYSKVILPFLPASNTDLSINKMQLHGINLSYHNQLKKQAVKVENIDLMISHFLSSPDCYSGHLDHFSYQETSDIPLVVKNMKAQFSITPYNIMLKYCHLITNHSDLQGDFTLKHPKQLPLLDEDGSIRPLIALEAKLHKTVLSSLELSHFSEFFKGKHTLYQVDGFVFLAPDAMEWNGCKLIFGDSYMEGSGCYNGVNTDVVVKAGRVYMHDLQQKPALFPATLQYVSLANTTLMGNTQQAHLKGDITTNIGGVQTDLTLKHLGKPTQAFTGTITLDKVAIDAVLPALPIQSLSGKVAIKAQGVHLRRLDAVADLIEIEANHYNYKQIEASCMLANAVVRFNLKSKDPNAKLTLAGSYHIAKSLHAEGTIEQVHLDKLGFVPTPLSLSTKFAFKSRDIASKRPRGEVILNQCMVQGLAKKVACKQIAIHAIEEASKDLLTLTSPFIDCRLQGVFTLNDLAYHIRHLIARLNRPLDLTPVLPKVHLDYAINCKKMWPVLNWFLDDLYISPATSFLGHFSYDMDYHFSLQLPTASTLCFKQCRLKNIQIKLNVRHLIDAKKRLIRLSLSSAQQDWQQICQTAHLSLQMFMDKDRFTISNSLSDHHNHLSLACSGRLTDEAIQIDLLPSTLTTQEQIWTITTERTSFISKSGITIGNVSIKSGQASICVGGQLTRSATTDPLYCTIRHVALNYASAVGPLKGIIDTRLVAHLEKDQIIATGSLRLKKATIQDYAIGTFLTKVTWNLAEHKLVLEGTLQNEDTQLLQVEGCYHLLKSADNLAITTRFNQMHLNLLNPFFSSIYSDISGTLNGQFQITGSLTAPKVDGKGTINQGMVRINYLNTYYQVAGAIQVRENRLYVDQLDLCDGASGHAVLSGHIVMQSGFPLMLTGKMEAFHLLHTTRIHNSDFYGNLYATGTVQMEGSIDDLLIKMKGRTDKGTFTIVVHDKEDLENTTKLVEFVYNKAKKQLDRASKNGDHSVIKLVLDLTILPTIKAQVLFGSYNNREDSLQGQGTGSIQLEVGTNRKPYVMGNYLFQSGTYTVSVYNLIQKTFTIAPNSQVNFNGYPQDGIAHIGASYRQIVSVTELYPQSSDQRPLPVEITLSAYGTLAHPHIAYQFFFPVKSMDFALNTALEECASKALLDKNYLNKQILSLLIAKRIYNDKKIDGWDALSNSINDFLSQRIQNLVSKIDHNLEIETDLGMNQSEHQDVNILQRTRIKLSYLLLSDDLKLSSTVGRSSRFINDWEISYRIAKAHNMAAKLYQQPLQTGFSSLSLFGISFAYTKKFW